MNRHEEIQLDLPAYADSRLEGPALHRMEEHLKDCEDCREMADMLREFGGALREGGEVLFEPHPSESALRKYVSAPGANEAKGIARHLAVCASCSLEVKAWTRRSDELRVAERSVPMSPRWGLMALASAAGLIVGFGLSVLLGDGRLPQAPRPSPAAETRPVAGPAVGPLLILRRALRGEGTAATYALDPNQEFVVLACPASLPDSAAPEDLFRYEIRKDGGEVVWSRTMTAADIRRHLTETPEVVTLLVPAASVTPGLYEFRLQPAGRPEETLYRARLVITGPR